MRVFIYVDAQGAIGKDVDGWKFEPAEVFWSFSRSSCMGGLLSVWTVENDTVFSRTVGWRGHYCTCLNAGVGRHLLYFWYRCGGKLSRFLDASLSVQTLEASSIASLPCACRCMFFCRSPRLLLKLARGGGGRRRENPSDGKKGEEGSDKMNMRQTKLGKSVRKT